MILMCNFWTHAAEKMWYHRIVRVSGQLQETHGSTFFRVSASSVINCDILLRMHCCSHACRDLEGLCNDKTPIGNGRLTSRHTMPPATSLEFFFKFLWKCFTLWCAMVLKNLVVCMQGAAISIPKYLFTRDALLAKRFVIWIKDKDNLERYGYYWPNLTLVLIWPRFFGLS